jgi:hypothetical protein
MDGDLDAGSWSLSRGERASAQGHDLVSLEFALRSPLCHLGRLAHEVSQEVGAFEDQVGDLCHLIEGHAGKAALELDSCANGRQALGSSGLDHGSSFVRETPLEIAQELHLAKRGTVVLGEPPSALSDALCESELDQELKPPKHLEPHLSGQRRGRERGIEGHRSGAIGSLFKDPVEDPEVPGFHSPLACESAVVLAPESQRTCRKLLAARADAVGDIRARHAEVTPRSIAASDCDVEVGVSGVLVLDRHPLEWHTEVALERCDELAGMAPKVHALPLLG